MKFKKEYIRKLAESDYLFQTNDFIPGHWKHRSDTKALTGGRGASYKINVKGNRCVLRRYLRGGMMSGLLGDRYFWMGMSLSRPYLEHKVTQHAINNNLPVAAVMAFWLQRTGIIYRAAIISKYLDNKGTLAALLFQQALTRQNWFKLGQLIRKFHQVGIYHADLNANNILVDHNDDFFLIDFDKARIKTVPGGWQKANLNRLLRSLKKIQKKRIESAKSFHFSSDDWQQFLDGYDK